MTKASRAVAAFSLASAACVPPHSQQPLPRIQTRLPKSNASLQEQQFASLKARLIVAIMRLGGEFEMTLTKSTDARPKVEPKSLDDAREVPGFTVLNLTYREEHMSTTSINFIHYGIFNVRVTNWWITPNSRVMASITEQRNGVAFVGVAALEIFSVTPFQGYRQVRGRIHWDGTLDVRVSILVPYNGTRD